MNTAEQQSALVHEQHMLREHLLGQLSTLDCEAKKQQRIRLQQDPDREDWAALFKLQELQAEKQRLKRLMSVEASLSLIEQEMYGICADCEELIEQGRLQADPAEQYCEACAMRNQQASNRKFTLLKY